MRYPWPIACTYSEQLDEVYAMKIVLHLTTACNLRCKYCYAPNTSRKQMPQETARAGIDLALELGTTSACVASSTLFSTI